MKRFPLFIKLITLCIGFLFFTHSASSQTKRVLFQGFWWDYANSNYTGSWANYLAELAPRLADMGVDAVWIPPSIKNQNFGQPGVGYAPFDHYDLGDKFQKTEARTRVGTKDELLRMIAVLHANGIEVIQDIVPNHIIGAGSDTGAGGVDPASTNDDYSNFRYSCWATPATDQSANDYLSREGRFLKNYQNFHPNLGHNCGSGDLCQAFFGPDVCYQNGAFGQSSNAIYNPTQSSNYMRDGTRNWLIWYKKQTGFDGVRMDAVKHYDFAASEDFLYNLQFNAGTASGGAGMFAVGEYVGGTADVDAWYNAVQKRAGVFDFSLRAFDGSGGLYQMVYGLDNYDMSALPAAQQTEQNRVEGGIHKTVPFVNNHDTFRPQLDASGNYIGWNTGDELSAHIEPNEPRLGAAYAVVIAMDGNPQIFFEDLFDIGYNGNRYGHTPSNAVTLPERSDIVNLIQCHQRLDFKNGNYKVRSAEPGIFVQNGAGVIDHLIIERSGQATIGITDKWDITQEMWVDSDYPQGTILMDYSGANGLDTYTVPADQRILVKTQPVNFPANSGQFQGYSVWAPVPNNTPFTSLAAMQSYLDSYANTPITTTQEWEMSDDLGDSHCSSLMQGGALPANSTNQRIVGKIYPQAGQNISYEFFHTSGDVVLSFYDKDGTELHTNTGANGTSGSFATGTTDWITIKVRNATTSNPKQTCYVKITYAAPTVVGTNSTPVGITKSIWTGNNGDSDASNCRNWEEGKIPNSNTDVIVPSWANPGPDFSGMIQVKNLTIENGGSATVSGTLEVFGNFTNNGTFNACGTVRFSGNSQQTASGNSEFCVLEINNNNDVDFPSENTITQELKFTNGKVLLNAGNLIVENTATITGFDANKYVQTANNAGIDGFLVQEISNANGNVIFPVGNTNYNPVSIANSGVTRDFSVRVFNGVLANGTTGATIENGSEIGKSWEITTSGADVIASVTVQWNQSEEGASFDSNTATLAKNAGSNWETLSSSSVSGTEGTDPSNITATNITSFSTFAVGSANSNFVILPVELIRFTANKKGADAQLNWSTASEINNEGFHLEKSINGKDFTKIGFVKGRENSHQEVNYEFLDQHFQQDSYYRLEQIDFDGKTEKSEIVFLKKENKSNEISIVPNPFSDKISIHADKNFDRESPFSFQLMNIDGKLLLQGNDNLQNVENALNSLLSQQPKGVFFLSIEGKTALKLLKE